MNRKVNREVSKKMNAAQEECFEEQCKNIEKGMTSGNNKETYNTTKALTKTQQHKSAVLKQRQQWKHPDKKHSCSKPVD